MTKNKYIVLAICIYAAETSWIFNYYNWVLNYIFGNKMPMQAVYLVATLSILSCGAFSLLGEHKVMSKVLCSFFGGKKLAEIDETRISSLLKEVLEKANELAILLS